MPASGADRRRAREPRRQDGFVRAARVADEDDRVVHDRGVAGQEVGGGDETIAIARRLEDELLRVLGLAGGQGERRRHLQRHGRTTSPPRAPRVRRFRRLPGHDCAPWRAAGHPREHDVQVARRQLVRIPQRRKARIAEPGRHVSRGQLEPDRFGPRARLVVRQQRHRRDAPWRMTRAAFAAHDRIHVLGVGVLRRDRLVRADRLGCERRHRARQHPPARPA